MKKLLIIFALLIGIASYSYGVDLYRGDIVNVFIEVTERDGVAFTIQTASYSVLDPSGGVLKASASAVIDGDTVYGLVDTTPAAYDTFSYAKVKFIFVIGDETRVYYVPLVIMN